MAQVIHSAQQPHKIRKSLPLSAVAFSIFLTACSSTQPSHANNIDHSQDFLFNDALTANSRGNLTALYQHQQQMQGSALGYYPEYFILNQNIATQPVEQILQFAQRHPQTAMTEKLIADYIEEKVKIGDTRTPAVLIPLVMNADESEACAITQIKASLGQPISKDDYRDALLKMDDRKQPELCKSLARNIINHPSMSQLDRIQRLFVVARAGDIGATLNTANAMGLNVQLSQLNAIYANPASYLYSNPNKNDFVQQVYLIFALGLLANNDLNQAFSLAPSIANGADAQFARYIYRTVGYVGANTIVKNGFNPLALQYFEQSQGFPFSPEESELYARQAIRFANWGAVIRAINTMHPAQQQEDCWQYWVARALEASNDRNSMNQATSIYQRLARSDDYHGLLSRMRLKQDYVNEPNDYVPTANDIARVDQDIHFARAFSLKDIGAPDAYSNREWNWAVRQAANRQDDALIIAAAQRADAMGWRDRSIFAADRTTNRHNYTLRYPMPYQNLVVRHSASAGIHPAWAYGIARQESRFNTYARSGVGATGMFQVMPETGRVIARQLGESYNPANLRQADTNVRYGTFYLGDIQSKLGGHPMVATAGYNTGPNRARCWMPTDQPMDADRYAETIPILETRDYVKHIITNAVHYGVHFGQGGTNLNRFMYPVPTQ
ncbi:transglycosylase SLT domain-containing protein [Acinetobacter sp. c2-A9]|uniref:lytic transglycosylase domain-containing protein n=1 Tax=Acinetobacter sp. c2-A9 TaxID=3342802 RepID=UPI0035B6FFDF